MKDRSFIIAGGLTFVLVCALISVLVSAFGESPLNVVEILYRGSLGTSEGLAFSIYYATPILFSALAVSLALSGGIFNIGAEGQATMAGVAIVAVGTQFNLPTSFAFCISIAVAFITGAAWNLISGFLRVRFTAHEVLTGLLLNLIAGGISVAAILGPLKEVNAASPVTKTIFESYRTTEIGFLGIASPASYFVFLGLGLAIAMWWCEKNLTLFLKYRWVAEAREFAFRSGMHVDRFELFGFAFSGGVAGLAALPIVNGSLFKMQEGAIGGAGFAGIAVALIARRNPLLIVVLSFAMGSLMKGTLDLELDTKSMTRDLALIVQGFCIFAALFYPQLLQKIKTLQQDRYGRS